MGCSSSAVDRSTQQQHKGAAVHPEHKQLQNQSAAVDVEDKQQQNGRLPEPKFIMRDSGNPKTHSAASLVDEILPYAGPSDVPEDAEQHIEALMKESRASREEVEKVLRRFEWDTFGARNALVRPANADELVRGLAKDRDNTFEMRELIILSLIYFSWNKEYADFSLRKSPLVIGYGLKVKLDPVMQQSGGTRGDALKALIQEDWKKEAALVAIDAAERKKPWPKACRGMGPIDCGVTADVALPPKYWLNKDLGAGQPLRCDALPTFVGQIEELLKRTFKGVATKDRRGRVPTSLGLVKCERIENPALWKRYHQAKLYISGKRKAGVSPVEDLDGDSKHGHVATEKHLTEAFADRTDNSINEFYLWHGTSQKGAQGICSNGFMVTLAGEAAGTMFGPGVYFAECSSKSDEYAKEWDEEGIYCLLLCRVICGEMFRIMDPKLPDIRKALRSGSYDTVLGDREAARGTYREFIVYDEGLIYPEYVVQYRRQYD